MTPPWLYELATHWPKLATVTLYFCGECLDVSFVPAGRETRKCGSSYCNHQELEPLLDFDMLTKTVRDMDGNIVTTRKGTKEPKWNKTKL